MITTSAILEIRSGAESREYPLTKQRTTIGRKANNDVVLNNKLVSREHARLEWKGDALYITDCKSANGTTLNKRKLEPYRPYQINEGDVISIGDFTLVYRRNRAVSSRTEVAGREARSGSMNRIVRSGWFIGAIVAVVILGVAALLWYFAPSLFSRSISEAKRGVVLIRTSDDSGAGAIISKSGYVLTCNHILKTESSVQIIMSDSQQLNGRVIARDEQKDLAIIKIDDGGSNMPTVALGDSDKLAVGNEVVVIGYPLGLKGGATVSKGIVSAFRNSDQVRYIQTDASFNQGSTGSPILNARGEVVGIMTAKVLGENVEGMAFAIAINEANSLISLFK